MERVINSNQSSPNRGKSPQGRPSVTRNLPSDRNRLPREIGPLGPASFMSRRPKWLIRFGNSLFPSTGVVRGRSSICEREASGGSVVLRLDECYRCPKCSGDLQALSVCPPCRTTTVVDPLIRVEPEIAVQPAPVAQLALGGRDPQANLALSRRRGLLSPSPSWPVLGVSNRGPVDRPRSRRGRVNGAGRVNGLINGTGPANATGRVNGLINGTGPANATGRVNGLAN